MATALQTKIVTENILQFTLTQNILENNFKIIAERIDTLHVLQKQLETNVNRRMDELEERVYLDLASMAPNVVSMPAAMIGQQVEVKSIKNVQIEQRRPLVEEASTPTPVRIQTKESTQHMRQKQQDNADFYKQISRLQSLLERERQRIDQLEELLNLKPQPSKKEIKQQPEDNQVSGEAESKRQLRQTPEYAALQSQINQLSKQFKNYVQKRDQAPKQVKIEVAKETAPPVEQVKEEIIVETEPVAEVKPEMTIPQLKQMIDQANFKISRLDGESVKLFKNINTLNLQKSNTEEQIASIIQKLKKLEMGVTIDIQELTNKVQSLPVRKTHAKQQKVSQHTNNDTNVSVVMTEAQPDTVQQKRLEEIMMELEDLKQEITTIIHQKEQHKRLIQQQKGLTSSQPPPQPVPKSNFQTLEASISSLKRDINSLKLDIDSIKGKDEMSRQIQVESQGRQFSITRPLDTKEPWKELAIKLQRVRSELLSYIKQLDLKINEKDETAEQLREVEAMVNENKILINKKADRVDIDRVMKRLEGRLNNFIKQSITQQELAATHDARIAKQPWLCLSCDNELKNYSGKQGKHLAKDLLPVKKLNVENHMVRRSIKDVDLNR